MKRRVITILILAFMLAVLTGAQSDCGDPLVADNFNGKPVIETEYYRVQMRYDEGTAIILDLTDEGKEQELLVIPQKIEGLTVIQLGYEANMFNGKAYIFGSTNLKKVYIPYTVEKIAYRLRVADDGEKILPLKSYVYGVDQYVWQGGGAVHSSSHPYSINLSCYYNYIDSPNDGYHWVDYITGGNLYAPPPDPVRDGYTFTGWYTDGNCETEWDNIMPSSAD